MSSRREQRTPTHDCYTFAEWVQGSFRSKALRSSPAQGGRRGNGFDRDFGARELYCDYSKSGMGPKVDACQPVGSVKARKPSQDFLQEGALRGRVGASSSGREACLKRCGRRSTGCLNLPCYRRVDRCLYLRKAGSTFQEPSVSIFSCEKWFPHAGFKQDPS